MLSKEQLKRILSEQRESILKKEIGIEREVLKKIDKKAGLPHVIVLTGIRRCGKSTILRQIIDKHYNDNNFYYINFEDERLIDFKAKDFNDIYECLLELFGEKKIFIIDEIQNVDGFENFVRRFYDNGFKLYITGSNAKLLSKELGTKLTGRHIDIVVRPFSFREFLKLKKFEFEDKMIYSTENRAKIIGYFEEFLTKGGMPEYLIYDDAEILMRIYEDIVIKDIVVRYNIESITRLRELYLYLITNFSKRFSFNSIKKIIGFGSVNTIKRFIYYLEESYLARTVNKFDYSLKKQIINDKKLYVLDNGFVSIISSKTTNDRGWLLENLVCNVLENSSPLNEIFYYLNKGECDFLVVHNKKIKSGIQVCFELNEKNRDREIKGLEIVMEQFNPEECLILTYNQEEEIIISDGKKICVKPVWKWILECKNGGTAEI